MGTGEDDGCRLAPPRRRTHLAAGAACLLAFAMLAAAVTGTNAPTRFDIAVNGFFAPWRHEPALAAFLWITAMGTGAALFGVMLAASGLLWAHRRGFLLPPLWLAYLGAEATTWGTKFLVDRHRPVFIEAASASSPSFPSAHSAGAMLVWGFLAYLVARELPTSGQRRAAIATAAILLALIGFSRIFLSVHYLSDVLGGYLLSAFWLAVGIDLAERARPR